MPHPLDIAIIGGGAAGLASGIFAGEAARRAGVTPRIAILDGAARLGAKILVSGGGRCNVTHERVTADDFNGPRNIVRNILRAFDEKAAERWFASMGVELKREPTGKLFPVTDSARTVLEALTNRCTSLGVQIRTGHRVHSLTLEVEGRGEDDPRPQPHTAPPLFTIHHADGTLPARRVILATGGRSLPKTGSDGEGWRIVRELGHTVTPTYPALAPLVLDASFFHADVSGLSLDATLSTFMNNKRIDQRTGSLLFTHFGVSGPVAMDASRHWLIAHAQAHRPTLRMNMLPGDDFTSTERWLIDAAQRHPRKRITATLAERLPQRLAEAIVHHVKLAGDTPLGQLPREARRSLVHALVELELPVVRDRGWNYAEVTAGGVPLSEIDYRTMASRIRPGLYLIGEMLDCDGRIGGFNFQWAWATGHIAGQAAVKSLGEP